MDKKMWLNNRPVFGNNWARFFIFVGSRGCGKTFMSQNYCLRRFFKYGEKFLWLRLTEGATKKLLQRDGADFIDAKLMDKWNITKLEVKGDTVFLNGKEACKILALSTFYNSKGVALNGKLDKGKSKKPLAELYDDAQLTKELKKTIKKYKTIVLDEMNREKNEKKSFDICYAFVNQIETICRMDTDRRIIMAGNTLDEASDVLAGCFNFIPEKLGLYKLHNKKAIVYYADDSDEYKQARKESLAGLLMPNESTFTNTIISDTKLVTGTPATKPTAIIRFSNKTYFTLCGGVITMYKQPEHSKLPVIAMRPYLVGIPYYKEKAMYVVEKAQQRIFTFDKLITLKLFYKEIKQIKGE